MSRLKVLICDDAVLYATMMSAYLEDDPEIEVVGLASSAPESLEQALRLDPDVVVLDHVLPGGTSPTLVPQLRARAPGAAVVLISGLPEDSLADVASEVGADAWVTKASTQTDLRAAIITARSSPR